MINFLLSGSILNATGSPNSGEVLSYLIGIHDNDLPILQQCGQIWVSLTA